MPARRLLFTALAPLATVVGLTASGQSVPQPVDAITAVLAAFDRFDIVGMNAAHSNEKQDAFVMALVRTPAFAAKVNDLVVECGNGRYQALLDRYIAGDDVTIEDARKTWRETSLQMCALSGFYNNLFPAIRALNQTQPADRRLRVLVGEPGDGSDRGPYITSVLTHEVLAKHRKALALFGVGHLYHDGGTSVTAYEKEYPGKTYVIETHHGFAAFFDLARGQELEARMAGWPAPSIVPLQGTWIADLDLPYFLWPFVKSMAGKRITDLADAYLYLGPGSSLTYEPTPDALLDDAAYMAEASRRFGVDVDRLRLRNQTRALYTATDIAEAHQFAPGAECVGPHAGPSGDAAAIEVDFNRGMLSARRGSAGAWIVLTQVGPGRYSLGSPSGPIEITCQK